MDLFITCDADWEARVNKVLDSIRSGECRDYFSEKYYGSSLEGVAVTLVCLDSDLELKQRVQLSKKEKVLYIDIILDLDQFRVIDQKTRNEIVVEKLITEVPPIIAKYKLSDFDLAKFEKDFKFWMLKAIQ